MPVLRKSQRLLDRKIAASKIAASKESPVYVGGSRPQKPSLRTEKFQTRAAKKISTAETKRGDRGQVEANEPTAERNIHQILYPRNSSMHIRAPDILLRFMTIDLQNEPLPHEARLGISEGIYQEGEDMLARKLKEEGLRITDSRCGSMVGRDWWNLEGI